MARELTMPKLSDSMADAVILRWLKAAGDSFERGEGLMEVETDKATVVYEAEWEGTLESILVPDGGTAAVGEPIATVRDGEGGARREEARVERPVAVAGAPSLPTPQAAPSAADGDAGKRAVATPVARRTAVELGVSLHGLTGTGPGGRITVEDVTRVASEGAASESQPVRGKGDVTVLELTPTQSTIARRMTESAAIPTFTVSCDVDVSLIRELRRGAREEGDVPSLNDFLVKAVALTLREFPRFNASFAADRIESFSRVNVGFAVATDDALLVPVVLDADRKSLSEIAEETSRLADAARRRTLSLDDLQHGTFTVSNLGMLGVSAFTALIDPPQAAILAVGSARRAPVEDGSAATVFRDVLTVTLTGDHRVVYGADGARFVSRLRELLERPLVLTR